MDAPDAKRRKCRADDAMEPVFFYTELLTAFDIVGVIDFAWERARRAAVRLGVLFWALLSKATKLGKTHVAELHCLQQSLVPDIAAKKRRQRYAYLGGGQFN